MLLFQGTSESYFNLSTPSGIRQLEALGYANSCASPGWYYDAGAGVFKQAAANTIRISGCGRRAGLLAEDSQENLCLYSSEDNAAWLSLGTPPTRAAATSCINGKTAIKLTGAGTTSGIRQTVGTFSGSDDTFSVIVEQGTASACDIAFYNGAAVISQIRLTFATGAVTTIVAGATRSFAYKIADRGPNNGALWMLSLTDNGGAAARTVRFVASPISGTNYTYFHHAQLVESPHHTSPIVTTSASVSRAEETIVAASYVPSFSSAATIYAEIEVISSRDDATQYVWGCYDGGTTNAIVHAFSSGSGDPSAGIIVGGVLTTATSGVSASTNAIYKTAISHANGVTYAACNGTVGANAAAAGFPTGMAYSVIGNSSQKLLKLRIYDNVAYGPTELARMTT